LRSLANYRDRHQPAVRSAYPFPRFTGKNRWGRVDRLEGEPIQGLFRLNRSIHADYGVDSVVLGNKSLGHYGIIAFKPTMSE